MGWFKKLLGLEKEEPILRDTRQENISERCECEGEITLTPEGVCDKCFKRVVSLKELPQPERRAIPDLCALCSQSIGTDRWKKVGPNYMHKKCFKKKQKDMLNGR
jgi:hypothetical protein